MKEICLIYTTISSQSEAESLAEQAVTKSLAACVNIIPGATSVYAWERKIEKSQEYLMIFKTDILQAETLQAWIISNHPYSVPAILRGNVKASDDFFAYVKKIRK